ncbi:MAG: hypothetical protein AAB578_10975, partial [Elusimicrobiota bacterium]
MAEPIGMLERSRECLEAGRPSRALRALPSRGGLPAPLRLERDLLEAEAWRESGYFGRARGIYARVLGRGSGADPVLRLEASLGLASLLRSVGEGAAALRLLKDSSRLTRRLGARHYAPREANTFRTLSRS